MRGVVTPLFAIAAACGTAEPLAPSAPPDAYAQHDAAVLNAVVADLSGAAANDELWLPPGRERGEAILVEESSYGAQVYLRDGQMSLGLGPELWSQIGALAPALRERNAETGPLDVIFEHPDVRKIDFDRAPGPLLSQFRAYRVPDNAVELPPFQFALALRWPAYSADGTHALARVSFGPTAHGCEATLLLVREGGAWRVAWREVTYYL